MKTFAYVVALIGLAVQLVLADPTPTATPDTGKMQRILATMIAAHPTPTPRVP